MSSAILRAENVHYAYDRTREALRGVTLGIDGGRVVALIGPNGSGKSTFLKFIAGLLPTQVSLLGGTIWMNGENLARLSPTARSRRVAYAGADLRQDFPLTAQETVALALVGDARGTRLSQAGRERVSRAMARVGCAEFADRGLASLSSGERQRVALARAIAQDAPVLLLDETLSRMDLHHQLEAGRLLRALAAEGRTVILVAHDLNLASEISDHAVFLHEGRLVAQGPVKDTLTTKTLESLYPGSGLLVGLSPPSGIPKVYFPAPQETP